MTNKAFDQIKGGLEEALEHAKQEWIVNRLVWEKEHECNYRAKPASLFPTVCDYQVMKTLGHWRAKLRGHGTRINVKDLEYPYDIIPLGIHKTKEEAMAACQADYDRRWSESSQSFVFADKADDLDYLKDQPFLDCPYCGGSGHIDDVHTVIHPSAVFWKPIAECPKDEGKVYLLMQKTRNCFTAKWNDRHSEWLTHNRMPYGDDEILAYAEIPPCEVQP